jgi:DNA mismatch repair protein MutS
MTLKSPVSSPIFKEYCSYINEYKQKYGPDTLILMQVGSFYEIYAIINDNEQLGEVNIHHICQSVLNTIVSKKNNNILMGGVPVAYSSKYIKLLIDRGYTVVIVSQVTEKPNIVRKVTDIISPGTYLEEFNSDDNNYLMSIYIEKISHWIAVGISVIDISTGKNYVYQVGENIDNNFWKDEISRLINYYSPKEFIFQTLHLSLSESDIRNYWNIQNSIVRVNHYKDKSYENITYQNELLQKVFQFESEQSPIEQLDMTYKYELCKSYIYLLQYIYEHKVDSLRNINLPELIENIHSLSLTSNSSRQLNIVNNYSNYRGKYDSLYSICNSCGFVGGRRLLKHRLLYPSLDNVFLQKSYHKINCLRKDNFYKQLKPNLQKLIDLDKSLRRMGLDLLIPKEFSSVYSSYKFLNRILDSIHENKELVNLYEDYNDTIDQYNQFYQKITQLIDIQNLYDTEKSYFKPGNFNELDEIDTTIKHTQTHLECICKRLSSIIDSPNSCKMDYNEKHGYFLYCTKNRSKILDKRFKNIPNHVINVRDSSSNIIYEIETDNVKYKTKDGSNVIIQCDCITKLTEQLEPQINQLKKLNDKYWSQTMKELYNDYCEDLKQVHMFLSDIDVMCAGAQVSIENNYCQPEIIESEKSCVIAENIRHPIVECITKDTEYVVNTIQLGINTDGMLLFGTNACGKSTLMKAVGLSVIMAQAGLYVPCSVFQYKPYTKIFTRILNNDNIFRSQSTFAVEMMELKSIFQLADENSLVLGDELCSGTETYSALSIVSQSLVELSNKRSSFIITSHLHQLNTISKINSIKNMEIYHLKISYNNGVLEYDRKLQKGPGPDIYGLKVCEAMGLSELFIQEANKTLHELRGMKDSILSTKQSQYNKDVFMDECKVCGGKPEETHHIKEQYTADENNMIDHHHKNNKHNLVPLCKSCHNKVTYGNLKIYGWKSTSKGRELRYEYIQSTTSLSSSKYTQEQLDIILSYKDKIISGEMNYIECMNLIDSIHGFRPNRKILKELFIRVNNE